MPSDVMLTLACSPSDVDAATGACAHPMWVYQPPVIPELDATSGIAVGVAILLVWAAAYGFKSMKRAGD